MTEFSKNSRNKAETVSNTIGRSGQGPTHPSGPQSSSPSHYSDDNIENSQQESPEDNFQMGIQYIMPLIQCIKDENEQLRHERELIQNEMATLGKLSQGLLDENQKLRKHYSERTHDIRKIIDTITINTNEQISDINHQAFLLKESNCLLVKRIEEQMKAAAELDRNNHNNEMTLQQLGAESIDLQQRHRDLQIKNKQLFYRCQQSKAENMKINLAEDDEIVNNLLAEVNSIKKHNKINILRALSISKQHNQSKPLLEEHHASNLQQNQVLQIQIKELQEMARKMENKQDQSKVAHDKIYQALKIVEKNNERSKAKMIEQEEQLKRTKEQILLSKYRTSKLAPQLQKLKNERKTIQDSIKAKKQSIHLIVNNQKEESDKMDQISRKEIIKIKEEIAKRLSKANEELVYKLAPETAKVSEAIENTRQQYASLVQQVQQLRENTHRLENPIKEIIRLQFQLKKINPLKR